MYKVTFNKEDRYSYYNVILASPDKTHYINIYVSSNDNNIFVTISKSEDGFYFESPCDEAAGLEVDFNKPIDKVYSNIKDYFLDKGYQFSNLL